MIILFFYYKFAAEPDISEEDTTDDEGRSITTRKRRSASQQEQGPSNASNGSPGPSKMGRKRTRSDHKPSPVRTISPSKRTKRN